jgi:hypothetical protein
MAAEQFNPSNLFIESLVVLIRWRDHRSRQHALVSSPNAWLHIEMRCGGYCCHDPSRDGVQWCIADIGGSIADADGSITDVSACGFFGNLSESSRSFAIFALRARYWGRKGGGDAYKCWELPWWSDLDVDPACMIKVLIPGLLLSLVRQSIGSGP